MTDKTSLIDFPCDFALKIIGINNKDFLPEIRAIVCKHFPNTKEDAIKTTKSKNDNYLAITATVHTKSQPELDALYMELTKNSNVKMVL